MNQFSGHWGCSWCAQAGRMALESERGLWMNCRSLSGGPVASTSLELVDQPLHSITSRLVVGDSLRGPLARVHDRGVIAIAEGAPDRRQAHSRQLSRQIHGDLAGERDG